MGTLASGGQTFVDTFSPPEGQKPGPVSMKLNQIPLVGLREALAQMPSGSRWEVVLPPEKAYGNTPQSPRCPNQAVVFAVQLVHLTCPRGPRFTAPLPLRTPRDTGEPVRWTAPRSPPP